MIQPHEIEEAALGRRDLLSKSGGQAVLYRLPELALPEINGGLIYKEYRSKVIAGKRAATRSHLGSLMRVRNTGGENYQVKIDARSVWPLRTVVSAEGATGLIMREIAPKFYRDVRFSSGTMRNELIELDKYLTSDTDIRARGLIPLTRNGRNALFARIVDFVRVLHELDIVLGDINPYNIAVCVDEADQVRRNSAVFMDVDSYRVSHSAPAILQPHSPSWETPEHIAAAHQYRELVSRNADRNLIASVKARMRHQGKPSDVYKVGLLALRLYHEGANKTVVTRSDSATHAMTSSFGATRTSTILAALDRDPAKRPLIKEVLHAVTGSSR